MFKDAVELCRNVNGLVKSVFGINGEMVMGKLVQNIYEDVIQVQSICYNYS